MERMAGNTQPEYKYDLSRMSRLADYLGLMQPPHFTVHIAGTKGKGSVASMIASIIQANGYRVGLYTSPHLHTFRERIRINGAPISEALFAESLGRVWSYIEDNNDNEIALPTTFEMLTSMAMDIFKYEEVDVAILEVGLGGRLDATNVFPSDVAVITSISLDHTAILGSTLSEIASEKAGIIKKAQPVISAPQALEASAVIETKCLEVKAELLQVSCDTSFDQVYSDLSGQKVEIVTPNDSYTISLPLLGKHQAENAAVAITAVEQMPFNFTRAIIESGINKVKWDGRFQVVRISPYLIVDGAHNPYSMEKLGITISDHFPESNVTVIFGASKDKQLDLLASEVSAFADQVYVVNSRHPRSASPATVEDVFSNYGTDVEIMQETDRAIDRALRSSEQNDVIIVTGSLFVVAEALEWYFGIPPEWYPELSLPKS